MLGWETWHPQLGSLPGGKKQVVPHRNMGPSTAVGSLNPPLWSGKLLLQQNVLVFFYAVALVQFPCGPGLTLAAFALAVPSGGRGENPQHRQLLPIRKPQEPLQLLPLLSGMLPLLGGLWGGPQGFPTSATREWSAKALVTVACPWARQGTANPAGFRECWDL